MNVIPEDLSADVLTANVHALTMQGRSRAQVCEASPEGSVMALPDGDPVVYARGMVLGAPADDASRRATLSDVQGPGGVVVVFGLGMGHTVREIRSRVDAAIVVVEPSPGIARAVLGHGPTDLGGVMLVTDPYDLKVHWGTLSRGRPLATLVATPGYEAAFPTEYERLRELVTSLVTRSRINENTCRARSKRWLENVFENLLHVDGSIPALAMTGAFRGVPAFVVGAGPSLNRNGALLREAVGKGIVFAVDLAAKSCVRHGAEPQVLVSIEAIDLSHEIRDLPWIHRVIRAFSLLGAPATLRTGKGPLAPFRDGLHEFGALDTLLGVPGVAVGGSVSTAAFSIARQWGCDPIVLVGQDLAYPGGQAYADGCSHADSETTVEGGRIRFRWSEHALNTHGDLAGRLPDSTPLFEVEAWGGQGVVPASDAFNTFRAWFETIADSPEPGARLINASEGGSRIHGWQELRLEEVLAELPERGLTVGQILGRARGEALNDAKVEQWAKGQARLARSLRVAATRLQRAVAAAQEALDSLEPSRVNHSFRSLGRAEQRLTQAAERQRMPEALACSVLQEIAASQVQRCAGEDAAGDARSALQDEQRMIEVVFQAARDLEDKFRTLAQRHGTKALPNMEKVRCLC